MSNKKAKYIGIVFLALLMLQTIWTRHSFALPGDVGSGDIIHRTNLLIFQISFIIFATWIGAVVFEKIRLPGVLGEIMMGVVIGPYALGGIPLLGFADGIFPLYSDFPVSIELYGLATIASIILLFFAGLETDLKTFLKYSFNGTIIGIFGVIFSFLAGDFTGIFISKTLFGYTMGFMDPIPLFLGVISTATSVGISARILSEKRKINTPEGVTILSAAVIDDVLGIIILAVIIGMVREGETSYFQIAMISVKAIFMWLAFTVLGLIYAPRITGILKKIKDPNKIALISFAMALFFAGVFEKSGLAMIIGAYITGLSLSRTDLSYLIKEALDGVHRFLVPIFFCVMGMLINLQAMMNVTILKISFFYIIVAIVSKVAGCFFPALFLGFNWRGGIRIGVGMVPRGEVALIIAGISLAAGFINSEVFTIAVIMTFVTTLITPPILEKLFSSKASGRVHPDKESEEIRNIYFHMPSEQTAELIQDKVIESFQNEGYFIYRMDVPHVVYYIRKDESFITLHCNPKVIQFDCSLDDEVFVHTFFYEVVAEFEYFISNLKSIANKEQIGRKILETPILSNSHDKEAAQLFLLDAIDINLKSENKADMIRELVYLLVSSDQLETKKFEKVVKDVFIREGVISTGLEEEVALPHAKTEEVDHLMVAVGLKKGGIDFESFDKKPAKIFILTLAPKSAPTDYLKFMAEINKCLSIGSFREKLLESGSNTELYDLLISEEGVG